MSKEKKIKEREKVINLLAAALKKAGVPFVRDGWTENKSSKPPFDECEWLDIHLYSPKKTKRYTIHMYFTQNSTDLDSVEIFTEKKLRGYDEDNPKRLATYDRSNKTKKAKGT